MFYNIACITDMDHCHCHTCKATGAACVDGGDHVFVKKIVPVVIRLPFFQIEMSWLVVAAKPWILNSESTPPVTRTLAGSI